MKVVIVRNAPAKVRQSITGLFPGDWHIIFIPAGRLEQEIKDADVIVPEGTRIDGPLLEKANRLKLIQTGAGYDNVAIEDCTRRGIYVALNSQTHHMIGKKEIKLMKPGAFIINTSRGAVVDEAALIEALEHNRIGGAGLDVFETEPLQADSPLRKLDNVILSPHCAGEPDGLYFHKKRFQFFAANIRRLVAGKTPQNALNDLAGRQLG